MATTKKTSTGSRVAELEAELIGKEKGGEMSRDVDAGRQVNTYNTSETYHQGNLNTNKLMYKMGTRLRHPHQVLTNYAGVQSTNSEAHTLWEEALQYEQEKQQMDDTFRPKGDSEGMATQLGVAPTAFLNYRNSKNKLADLFVVGV